MAMRTRGSGVLLAMALTAGGWLTASAQEGGDRFSAPEGQDPFGESEGQDPFAGPGADPFGDANAADLLGEEADDPFGPGDKEQLRQQAQKNQQAQKKQPRQERERSQPAERPTPADLPQADPHRQPVYWAESHSESSTRIRRALDQKLSSAGLDFLDTPLEEVVDFLRNEYAIEIQLDTTALDDLGIGTDQQVTVNLRNISLKSALRMMLRQFELTYMITDEVLLITTEEQAETHFSVGIYPMVGVASDKKELAELSHVITSTVLPETWAINKGGNADLKPLSAGFLVISQTRAVHEQIIELLSALRRAKAAENPAPDPGPVAF